MSLVDITSQPLPPAWQRLADDLERAFTGRADLQAGARDAIAWLVEHSLDRPGRVEDAARVAMAAGVQEVSP
jgi:hypothetical protein